MTAGQDTDFTKVDVLGEEAYANWQNLDIGDVVGVEGEVYLTEKGEVSIVTHSYTLSPSAFTRCLTSIRASRTQRYVIVRDILI